MRTIKLTRGFVAIVDNEDFREVSKHKWTYNNCGYAYRLERKNGKQKSVLMHRLVAKTPDGLSTDHINGNKLDNRRCNLRHCTPQQNAGNSKKRVPKAKKHSQFKGVSWRESEKKWRSNIGKNGRNFYLGGFNNEKDAALAYDKAALDYYGVFAKLNFPDSFNFTAA